jgi:hypothetical protein
MQNEMSLTKALITLTWLLASAGVLLGAQTAAAPKPPHTEETVPVTPGARLIVDNYVGEVMVRGWERDAVRVLARHAARTRVSVRTLPAGVRVSSSGSQGPAAVDYEISVPRWMPVRIDGQFVDIGVAGTESEVAADTVRGDIAIAGALTFVSAKSVEGDVKVVGARGRTLVSSINQGVSVEDSSGDIVAGTVNGPIRLTNIGSANVDASTVNGHITYEGVAAPLGKYRFSSHNGNIAVTVPESSSATFAVRTYNGTTNTDLPVDRTETGRGRRATYTLGSGSAEFEVESFGGTIHLRRGPQPTRSRDTVTDAAVPDGND